MSIPFRGAGNCGNVCKAHHHTASPVASTAEEAGKGTSVRPLGEARLPVRVLQIGAGNFLRGFADWMIHKANTAGVLEHGVAVMKVTPRPGPVLARLAEQPQLGFRDLFEPPRTRGRLIGIFLALLELIKACRIAVEQATPESEIQVMLLSSAPPERRDEPLVPTTPSP